MSHGALTRGLASAVIFALSLEAHAAWEPVFVDNFDGTELDVTSWVPGSSALQRRINYYDRDALSVNEGKLVIGALNRAESDRSYTSGIVSTQGTFKQRYGYFEIRARIPKGNGFWPAFWLMPETGVWSSEIDVAEFRGHLPASVHYAYHYGNRLRNENGFTAHLPIDLSESYNNFAVSWTPARIDYLLNGVVMHSVTDPAAVANATSEMFLILNLDLASQHSGWSPTVDAATDLNQTFQVEYVRVYREAPNGRYATIPGPDEPVADVRAAPYDNTALSVERVEASPQNDYLRAPASIAGALEVTAHKDSYNGVVSIALTALSGFNVHDGGFSRSASLEVQSFNVSLPSAGERQVIDYAFATAVAAPAVYSVDVVVRDPANQNKKSYSGHRVVQVLDSNQPATTVWLDGYYRGGSASYADGSIGATLQLQLQQILLAPYLDVRYELVDTWSGEVLAARAERVEHSSSGLQTLTPVFDVAVDPARSVGLTAAATDSTGTLTIPSYAVHVAGTAEPPSGWNQQAGAPQPPPVATPIPDQTWRATFVDNFDGSAPNALAWSSGLPQLPRRINYYATDAVSVADGFLRLSVLNRPESDRPYATGAVSTQGLFKQQYGYFEVRARVPTGNGFWPAFWLMPQTGQWTSELEIAEFRGQLPTSVHYAFHYGNRQRNEHGATVQVGGDLSASFNNYALYWTPERIDYVFNGSIVHSVTDPAAVANANSEMFINLSLALASTHASNWIPVVDETTDLAGAVEIDYVRVYTPDPAGPYARIPPPDEPVPDLLGTPYDATGVEIRRVLLPGESDVLRAPGPITGAFEVIAGASPPPGTLAVHLVHLSGFDPLSGRYVESPALATRNHTLGIAGGSQRIEYAFDPPTAGPAAYSVNVVINDAAIPNKRALAGHRIVQFVAPDAPDATVFFEGFVRGVDASYAPGSIAVSTSVQLQQALLTPYLRVYYSVLDAADGTIVAYFEQLYEHEAVGLVAPSATLAITLDPQRDYDLHVDVTDSGGRMGLDGMTVPIAAVGSRF